MKPLRLGFMTAHNPYNRNSFSGTVSYMKRGLEARDDVELVVTGGHAPPQTGLLGKIRRRVQGRPEFRFDAGEYRDLDAVIAPVASHLVAQYAAEITPPIYLVTDATPAFLREFYNRPVAADKEAVEARALKGAAHVVYSSQYMAARAVTEYDALTPERAHAMPFGINLDRLPESVPDKPPLEPLRLLFIGQDWSRKGGAYALGALEQLRARGVAARLTVIGSSSPEADADNDVEVLGYLDKNLPQDAERLTRALEEAHVFILPTRADCTPMVVAEANSYGCPVLISDVGGVGSLMEEGRNGRMMPLEAEAEAWAEAILSLVADADDYRRLSRSSFEHAHARLTWQAWSDSMVGLIRETVTR